MTETRANDKQCVNYSALDALEVLLHELGLFSKVITAVADDYVESKNEPLDWKAEALALLCRKATCMVETIGKTLEEARQHGS